MKDGPELPARPQVIVIDSSCVVGTSGSLDYNALDQIAVLVAAARTRGEAVSLAVGGAVRAGSAKSVIGRSVRGAARDRALQAVGVSIIGESLRQRLRDVDLEMATLVLSRRTFSSRNSFSAARELMRSLTLSDVVPVMFPDPFDEPESGVVIDEGDQIGAMCAGVIGAENCLLVNNWGGPINVKDIETGLIRPLGTVQDVVALEADISGRRLRPVSPSTDRVSGLLSAARLLKALGCQLTVSSLSAVANNDGSASTTFVAPMGRGRLTGARRWLSLGAIPVGTITASPNAVVALEQPKRGSLLMAGVVGQSGAFKSADVVAIEDESGRLVGYGVARMSAADLATSRHERDTVVVHADYFFGRNLP